MSAILSAGYNVDFIDAEAINSVGLGTHQILVIPPTDRIPYDAVNQISLFAANGGKVVALGHAPSLTSDGKPLNPIVFKSFSTTVPDASALGDVLRNSVLPDLQLTTTDAAIQAGIGFIRRKLPDTDIYFVANTTNHPIQTVAHFTTTHQKGEQWDPDTTASTAVDGAAAFLNLAPYESRIFIFTGPESETPTKTAAYTIGANDKIYSQSQLTDLSADWQLQFTATGKSEPQPKLTDWIADPSTRNYSGEAVYTRDFNIASVPTQPAYLQVEGGSPLAKPGEEIPVDSNTARPAGAPLPNPLVTRTGPGMRAWYDPPIHEAAIVYINGQRVGSLWHPPYQLDVTRYLKAGQNHIELRVYNTAINAWAGLPPHDYKPLIAKYGDRFQMQDLDKVQPVSSGLLGKIHLVQESK